MLAVFRDLLVNLAATVIGDAASPSGMIGFVITMGAIIYITVMWHRRQREKENRGMDSWYFIVPSLVVAMVAVAAAFYGIGLRSKFESLTRTYLKIA